MLRGVVIVFLGACGFESGNMTLDALAGPAIDANVEPDAPPDAAPDAPPPMIPPLCDPMDGLVACYTFEETVEDLSGNKLNPVMPMGVAFSKGRVNNALDLTASTVLNIADKPALNVARLTIEAWVKLPSPSAGDKRAVIVDADGQYNLFVAANGEVHCTLGGVTELVAGPINRDAWVHLACTYNGANATLYIDGVLRLTEAATAPLGTTSMTGMSIGLDNAGPMKSHLVGSIDELRLMSIARTPAEICASTGRYDCLLPVPPP